MNDHKSVEAVELPKCDFCGKEARYDGLMKTEYSEGVWGYMCETHFKIYGVGLGLGKGQELIIIKETK